MPTDLSVGLAPHPLGNVDNRLLPCGSDQDLRRFTLRQRDPTFQSY